MKHSLALYETVYIARWQYIAQTAIASTRV